MYLNTATIRPGNVVEVLDEQGTIRATAYGLFTDADGLDVMPPIYPLCCAHTAFSSPKVGDKVWVLSVGGNPHELLYVRMNTARDMTDVVAGDTVEVLAKQHWGNSWAQIFFNNGTGWKIQSDNNYVQLDNDGNIILNAVDSEGVKRTIDMNAMFVNIGTAGEAREPAVLGNKMYDTINSIVSAFADIADCCDTPELAPIRTAIEGAITQIQINNEGIRSLHVTLD